jgi:hypothetical protein
VLAGEDIWGAVLVLAGGDISVAVLVLAGEDVLVLAGVGRKVDAHFGIHVGCETVQHPGHLCCAPAYMLSTWVGLGGGESGELSFDLS